MSNKSPNKLLVILGPTASGKTELAIKLAKDFKGEIVSADSRQAYREFSIGTGKPAGKWQIAHGKSRYIVGGVPHYLMDEIDPKEEFTLVDFKKRAIEAVKDIHERGKIPFLVGGAALYIYTITQNMQIPEVPPQISFRARLENKPVEMLYGQLKKVDPDAAELTGKNKRRIIRALEVIKVTGKKFSSERKKGPRIFDDLKIGIAVSKSELEEKIKKRMDEMLKAGLLREVKNLARRYSWEIPAMQSIDYQEFRAYLAGEESLEETIKKIIKAHKAFARRQMTWFKRDKEIWWVRSYEEAKELVDKFLSL